MIHFCILALPTVILHLFSTQIVFLSVFGLKETDGPSRCFITPTIEICVLSVETDMKTACGMLMFPLTFASMTDQICSIFQLYMAAHTDAKYCTCWILLHFIGITVLFSLTYCITLYQSVVAKDIFGKSV